MKTATILCAVLMMPGLVALSDKSSGPAQPAQDKVNVGLLSTVQPAPAYHRQPATTAPNAIQADAQRMGLPAHPSLALSRPTAPRRESAPRPTRRTPPSTAQYASPGRGNAAAGGVSYGQSGFGPASRSGYTRGGAGMGGQGGGAGRNQGFGGGGIGGGQGGAAGFSNITQLFSTIDDAAVGEWPPPLLGPVHIQRQYPHRR